MAAASLALVMGACGRPGPANSGGPPTGGDTNVSHDATSGGKGSGPRALVVSPQPGMEAVHPVALARYRVRSGGMSVMLFFWGGKAPCDVLDHVSVDYTRNDVAVGLFSGSDPRHPGIACAEIALLKAVSIPLAEPLGGRPITDANA